MNDVYGPNPRSAVCGPMAARDMEERDVPREVSMLNAAVSELSQAFDSLVGRLGPSLSLSPPRDSATGPGHPQPAPSPAVCPLAASLFQLRLEVQRVDNAIREVRDRVQL